MENEKTHAILEKLMNVYDFNVPEDEEHEFRNFLMELLFRRQSLSMLPVIA